MKYYTSFFAAVLSLTASSVYADVDPEYFCHDLRGHSPGENNDVWSNIATFWKNREGLYELAVAGPNLAPRLVVPGKAPTRYTRRISVVFQGDECKTLANGSRQCHRVSDQQTSPIWIWGGNEDIGSAVTKVSPESPESIVKGDSIDAYLNDGRLKLNFTTIEGKTYRIRLSCDAPSWDWYPHVPLDELGAKVH